MNCSTIKELDFLDLYTVDDKKPLEGKRLDISVAQKEIKIDIEASKLPITLEGPVKNSNWSQQGKNNYSAPENLFINDKIEFLWK